MTGTGISQWSLVRSGVCTGAENMRRDVLLAEQLQRGELQPTLRLYGWKPWAVSLGYNQSEEDIDRQSCERFGFDIVRRPTGGRAILHANELTYAVVMPAEGKGITEVYSLISKALVTGLSAICPSVSYETSQPNLAAFYKRQESIPCFSASARYEVQVGGRKLVGSAQRRFTLPGMPEVILQHGSILLGPEHRLLADVLRVEHDDVRRRIVQDIEHKTIDLSEAAGRTVTAAEAEEAVIHGFERELGIGFALTGEQVL